MYLIKVMSRAPFDKQNHAKVPLLPYAKSKAIDCVNSRIYKHYQSVNGLDSDQFIGPDLGPICLQKLSTEEKSHR